MRTKPFFAARLEQHLDRFRNKILRRLGWHEEVVPFAGYGSEEQIRILGRLVLRPRSTKIVRFTEGFLKQRCWRNFLSAGVVHGTAYVKIANIHTKIFTDRQGYIDYRFNNPGLKPGWRDIILSTVRGRSTKAPVQIIAGDVKIGIVSDVDDTILSTWLPRPLLAAWNSLILTEQARKPVPGMARLFQDLKKKYPNAPIIYLSTGSWNTQEFLLRFTKHYAYPPGTFLLTDWGPTNTGWFRSGVDHKTLCLRELARDYPKIKWILIGDDGQHDPEIYQQFATLQPNHVLVRAIRQLSPAQQVLAHGTLNRLPGQYQWNPYTPLEVRGTDGDELNAKLGQVLGKN